MASQPGRPSTSLHYAVGEISGKLDQVISSLIPLRGEVEGIDGRVAELEVWRGYINGSLAVISLIITSGLILEVLRYVGR